MARKAVRTDVQVKIDAEVVKTAKIIAAYRGVTMAEYLSGLLAPMVMRDLAEEQAKGAAKRSKPKGAK